MKRTVIAAVLSVVATAGISRAFTGASSSSTTLRYDVEPGVKFSLIDLAEIKDLLEDHLNRKVDVVTQAGLAPDVRERVLQEAASVF